MQSNVAIITVPLTEWNAMQSKIENIDRSLLALQGKDKSEFLTPKEVCELLKCSRNTFQSYVEKGFITAVKMKSEKYSKVIVKRADVDYFLASRIN